MGAGAATIQDFHPVNSICRHVSGFHFYAHDMSRQVPAHHYCTHLSEDLLQCLVYDTGDKNARLIGIEYIISEKLFQTLPAAEKSYWHSHLYEVKGGLITLPVANLIPKSVHEEIEREEFGKIINTYGKTWHFWQVDRGDELPFGPPQLMMAFTEDGQIDADLLKQRDQREKVDTTDLVNRRRDTLHKTDPVDPEADHWQKGEGVWQAKMEKVEFKGLGK
ncbi:hypothetical protein HDV00_008581 [Rhizophlyctis rosea]|nr:hypothetical protein HDV00_008581 [Rhizophlyctis rosea]